MLGHFKLQPWNITEGCARSGSHHFGFYPAPIDVLPVRPRVKNPDRFAVEDQRGSRLADLPYEFVRGINFALIDLRTFSMKCRDDRLTVCGDRGWNLRDRGCNDERTSR